MTSEPQAYEPGEARRLGYLPRVRIWISDVFYAVGESIDPREPPIDFEVLNAAFERKEGPGWQANVTVQSEATKLIGFLARAMMGEAENYCATKMEIRVQGGQETYDIRVQRVAGKTVSDRIAELKNELNKARAS